MNQHSRRLDCSEIIIRLLSASRHLENGAASAEAFMLREGEERLSVFRHSLLSHEQCRTKLRKVYGQATLHVGRVRGIDLPPPDALDAISDEEVGGFGHASITGLPGQGLDRRTAERLAGLLRDQSRTVLLSD